MLRQWCGDHAQFFGACYNVYRLVVVSLFATFALFCFQLLSTVFWMQIKTNYCYYSYYYSLLGCYFFATFLQRLGAFHEKSLFYLSFPPKPLKALKITCVLFFCFIRTTAVPNITCCLVNLGFRTILEL